MNPPQPLDLLQGIQATLLRVKVDYERLVGEFGQVRASEQRQEGKPFGFREHLRGLVLSLLSQQRPWGPIARNLKAIDTLFLGYDPDRLVDTKPDTLLAGLRAIRCSNRSAATQMRALAHNIARLRRIEADFGSLDKFVKSDTPDVIAKRLAKPGPYKLRQVGYALALEYLRNVGIRAGKPDVHIRRILSEKRLAYCAGDPSEEQAYRLVEQLAQGASCNPTYLDNLLWLFCAQDYGNVCGVQPKCSLCALSTSCRYPRESSQGADPLMA